MLLQQGADGPVTRGVVCVYEECGGGGAVGANMAKAGEPRQADSDGFSSQGNRASAAPDRHTREREEMRRRTHASRADPPPPPPPHAHMQSAAGVWG